MNRKKRILLVDDNFPLLETLSFFLKEADYDVHLATDAKEAVRQLQRENFEAMILDYRVRGNVNEILFEQVRTLDPAFFPRLLVMTSDLDDPRLEPFRAKAEAVLAKPFDFGELLRKLEDE